MPMYRSNSPQCPGSLFWVVKPGDTLYGIAQATRVPLPDVLAANPGIDPMNLQPGQRVCLPPMAALPKGPVPPCPSGLYWVIAPQDTLYSIAQSVGTTVEELLRLNPGIEPWNLQIGSSLCLPGSF